MSKIYTNKDFLHPITREYIGKFIAAGVRIPPNINEVDQFIKELSVVVDPSLWLCWLMRSSHNAGTGTSLFSFGGLGNYIGTLENSPTWEANGITFIAANGTRISTNLKFSSQDMTILAVSSCSTLNAVAKTIAESDSGSNPNRNWALNYTNSGGTSLEAYRFSTSGFISSRAVKGASTPFEVIGSVSNSNFLNLFVDGVRVDQDDNIVQNMSNTPSVIIGGRTNARGLDGTISMVLLSPTDLSDVMEPINSIIRRTVGKGLF